jgi:hypothetical protein
MGRTSRPKLGDEAAMAKLSPPEISTVTARVIAARTLDFSINIKKVGECI